MPIWTAVATATLCAAGPLLPPTTAHAAGGGTGSLSGVVVDEGGLPRDQICVNVENGPGTQTDANGDYIIDGLDTGDYHVQFSDCSGSPTLVTQWYSAAPDSQSAQLVHVDDGSDTALDQIDMQPGVVVNGTVTDGLGDPINGINVWVSSTGNGGYSSGGQTGVDGTYATSPLPSGGYRVQFSDPSMTWASQFWNHQLSWSSAGTLTIDSGDASTASGIDAVLAQAATLSGTITDTNGQPIDDVCVSANLPGSDYLSGATSANDGTYTIGGLPPATDLRIAFHDCATPQRYLDEWLGGTTDWNNSTPVTLSPAEQRSGADAQLQAGIAISGTVTDSSGQPIEGVNVNVNPTSSGPSGWAQTASDGTYTTSLVPPGDYRVQFTTPGAVPAWATQYWDAEPSWNTATILTIAPADAPVHSGVDAVLDAAATITGVVTGPDGQPVEGICVTPIINTPSGPDGLGGTSTAADGTYSLVGLAAMDVKVLFEDCNHRGPFARQLWQDSRTLADSTSIHLSPGVTVTQINAQLDAASSISGTVSDSNHTPLAGICVQASTDNFVGGLTATDNNGNYTLALDQPGDYHVQFVDCTSTPTHAGQWWNTSSSGVPGVVTIASGAAQTHIDAELQAGGTATISGTVRNAHGDAITSACVIAYLPNQYALIAPVNPDGSYTLHDVPSGTFALAFLGCDHGNPVPTITDPSDASLTYAGVWWHDAPLAITSDLGGGPDPIAQGATLLAIAPGAQLTGFDHCFGCTPPPGIITITSVTTSNDTITVAFATSASHTQSLAAAAAPTVSYTLTCSSTQGATRSASGTASPLTVTGVTPGATYTCVVTSSDGTTTAASSSFSVAVPASGSAAAAQTSPEETSAGALSTAEQPVAEAAAAESLPKTGSDPSLPLEIAVILLVIGIGLRVVLNLSSRTARR